MVEPVVTSEGARVRRIGNQGIYNNDYFSGCQVAVYIGDVLIDECTSLTYAVHQSRTPIYGYASTLFDAVSEGNVLVQGEFSINFKEAGYLWLILNRYKSLVKGQNSFLDTSKGKHRGEISDQRNIEQIVNGEAKLTAKTIQTISEASARASLAGFSSAARADNGIGKAEGIFETFENAVWGPPKTGAITRDIDGKPISLGLELNRRADVPALNPFDIYVAFGDFVDDDSIHHTVEKIAGVHLLGKSKTISIDGVPVQEVYSFLARDLV
jgi:hypothetical protein